MEKTMSENDTNDTKVIVMRCPSFMAEALQKAAKAELASVNYVCKMAVFKDLKERGLVAA